MKNGLVLEGGAMRGLFIAGVIDVLLENNLNFDGAIGVSAGAAFGCNYKSKQSGRVLRYNLKYIKDKRYCSIRSLLKTGNLFNAEFCYHTLPDELDKMNFETYSSNPCKFYCVVSDIENGKAEYFDLKKLDYSELEILRASASMPLVSKIIEQNGRKFLDGGIFDSIPLKAMENLGFEKNLVVLTQPKNYVKKPISGLSFIKLFYKKYPKMIEGLKNRHKIYNEETKYVFEQQENKKCLVICPETTLGISRLEKNPEELKRVYELGRTACENRLGEIKEFFFGK